MSHDSARSLLRVVSLFLMLFPPFSVRGESGPRRVSLNECIFESLRLNPAVKQAEWGTQASVAAAASTRGGFGPTLSLDGNLMRWDEPIRVSFSSDSGPGMDPNMLPPPTSLYEQIVKELISGFSEKVEIQKQVTWSVSATVAQPITPLWSVYKAWELAKLGIDVARFKEIEVRNQTALSVAQGYYGHLQARAVWEAMKMSIERVEAALNRVRQLKEAGLVGKGDVLKVQVALAGVRQAEVQARAAVDLTRGGVATHVGWGATAAIELADIPREMPALPVSSLDSALALASSRRVELAALRKQLAQATLGEELVWSEYVPTLVALGSYVHAEGSRFRKEDSWFVGATLSWKLWENGRSWYKIDEARARARQLSCAIEQVEALIRLEVNKAWLDYSSALEVYSTSDARVAEAEENFRAQQKLYEAEYKTSTDLLDAEAALTEALAQKEVAFYKLWAARAALGKAIGEPIDSWLPPGSGSGVGDEGAENPGQHVR